MRKTKTMKFIFPLLFLVVSCNALTLHFRIVGSSSVASNESSAEIRSMVWKTMGEFNLKGAAYTTEFVFPSEGEINTALAATSGTRLPAVFNQGKDGVTVVIVKEIKPEVGGLAFVGNRFILLRAHQSSLVLAHEVGHEFCLEHDFSEGNLMNPKAKLIGSNLTTEQLQRVRACGLS